MRIFIGSSSEYKEIVEEITNYLREKFQSVTVRPWMEVFSEGERIGKTIIEILLEETEKSNLAIFIFGKDDMIESRGNKQFIPRDNVILEYGMFLAKLGKEKVVIVRVDDAKIPTDLDGVLYATTKISYDRENKEYLEKIAKKITEYFKHEIDTLWLPITAGNYIVSLIDKNSFDLEVIVRREREETLHFYKEVLGAQLWRAVEKDKLYTVSRGYHHIGIDLASELKKRGYMFKTVIFFGSGIGETESALVRALTQESQIEVVNFDINPYLCITALKKISSNNSRPFCGLIGDFEKGIRYKCFSKLLETTLPPPKLFVILGGTFSNLTNPVLFIRELANLMQEKDLLILDTFTYETNYNFEKDRFYRLDRLPLSVKRFLCGSLVTMLIEHMETLPYKVNSLFTRKINSEELKNSENIINFLIETCSKEINDFFRSEILDENNPKSTLISIKPQPLDYPVLTIRRYDSESLKEFLKSLGLSIVHLKELNISDERLKRTLFLLQKTSSQQT